MGDLVISALTSCQVLFGKKLACPANTWSTETTVPSAAETVARISVQFMVCLQGFDVSSDEVILYLDQPAVPVV